jgi:hypothetical protein
MGSRTCDGFAESWAWFAESWAWFAESWAWFAESWAWFAESWARDGAGPAEPRAYLGAAGCLTGGSTLRQGALVMCPGASRRTTLALDSVEPPVSPPAPRLSLKTGTVGEAEAGPAPPLKARPRGAEIPSRRYRCAWELNHGEIGCAWELNHGDIRCGVRGRGCVRCAGDGLEDLRARR